jgi:hypothetical protein
MHLLDMLQADFTLTDGTTPRRRPLERSETLRTLRSYNSYLEIPTKSNMEKKHMDEQVVLCITIFWHKCG